MERVNSLRNGVGVNFREAGSSSIRGSSRAFGGTAISNSVNGSGAIRLLSLSSSCRSGLREKLRPTRRWSFDSRSWPSSG
ncbi:hypothetical protein QX201_003685 [Fusarium graminearum]